MKHTKTLRQKLSLLGMVVLVVGSMAPSLVFQDVHAGQIVNRSLTLIAGASDGGSAPSGTVNHLFTFDIVGGTNVGSMKFEYCTTAAAVPNGLDCDAPTGLDATAADLTTENGVSGFSVDSTTANEVVLARSSASSTTAGTVEIQLDDIVNPEDPNETFFVRITTHQSLDGTGAEEDFGTVAASTAEPIILSGTMPESLVFCTGGTIDFTGGVPDCSTATSGSVSFDQLFSPTDTATALSQMAASTNAGQGYAITVNGPTLTSGSNTIDVMDDGGGGPEALVLGTSQFGMNMVENSTTTDANGDPLGLNVDPTPNATNYLGEPATNYDQQDLFKFGSGDVVSNSSDGTDSQIFTSSYVVNVPGSQPAGTYTTTLTYIATATF